MEIPIAVPVDETTGSKKAEYMDAKIHGILHPDTVHTDPFMKKIVSAALCVTTCKEKKTTLVQSMTWIKQKNNIN